MKIIETSCYPAEFAIVETMEQIGYSVDCYWIQEADSDNLTIDRAKTFEAARAMGWKWNNGNGECGTIIYAPDAVN